MELSRRSFLACAAAGVAGSTLALPVGNADEASKSIPDSPIDGAFTTQAMGHETWVYVTTTFQGDAIVSCQVVSHRETIGIGSYACSRIPAAIVANQSLNVPNVRGAGVTSRAVKSAVEEAIVRSGRSAEAFSSEIAEPLSTEHLDLECDAVVVGGGTAGLVAALRMLEEGLSVIVIEKLDIPGGSASMTMGGVQTAGSRRQESYDLTGSMAGTATMDIDAKLESLKGMVVEGVGSPDGDIPFSRATYEVSGEMADWLSDMGAGFMTLGAYEGAASYGFVLSSAPGMYCGGAGYQTMFMADRIASYESARLIYATTVTGLIQNEAGGYAGVEALGDNGATYTVNARAVCLATGGFAKNTDLLKEYCPNHADQFFNCCSASTGDGVVMGLAAGSPMSCVGRYMPAYLATAKSGVELAFLGLTAPGLFINGTGDDLGSSVSHTNGETVKLDPANNDTFYYVFDDSSACKARHNITYGMDAYAAIFDREEAVRYDSVQEAADALGLLNLAASLETNNENALNWPTPGSWGAPTYVETRDGIWVLPVTPNFYLTTAGLTIDVDCHLLDEAGNPIAGLYAAGDVTASPEERDGIHYGFGYSTAMAFGYRMASTLVTELA